MMKKCKVITCGKAFPGATLFNLKATHGLPLDETIHQVMVVRKTTIDWVGFIEEARHNGWWDFQILASLVSALQDAGVEPDLTEAIRDRSQVWIMDNPHPKMVEVTIEKP